MVNVNLKENSITTPRLSFTRKKGNKRAISFYNAWLFQSFSPVILLMKNKSPSYEFFANVQV